MLMYLLKNAWLNLLRRPAFSTSVILSMGLTLALLLNASGLFYYVMWQPLPYPAADQLYKIDQQQLDQSGRPNVTAYGYASLMQLYQLAPADSVFNTVALAHYDDEILASHPDTPKLATTYVTAEFLPLLGASTQLGQLPAATNHVELAPPTAVLSAASWHSLFGADPEIVGKTLVIRGQSFVVSAVLASNFIEPELWQAGRQTAVWLSWQHNPVPADIRKRFGDRTNPRIAIGQLKSSLTPALATQQLTALMDQHWQQNTADIDFYQGWHVRMQLQPLRDVLFSQSTLTAWLMLACAGGLLLIASANLANLLLSRAAERQKELAISAAVGATPSQLRLLIFSEIMLLLQLSAVTGWGLSLFGLECFRTFIPDALPLSGYQHASVTSWFCAAALMTLIALALTLLCCRFVNFRQLQGQLASGSKGGSRPISRRTRQLLVFSQVSVSVSAALMLLNLSFLSSALNTMQDRQVFTTNQLHSLEVRLNSPQPLAPEQYSALLQELQQRLEQLPQVLAVSRAISPQLSSTNTWSLIDEKTGQTALPQAQIIDEHFFQVTKQPLLSGQDFTTEQIKSTEQVLIINDVLANQLYSGSAAVGQRLSFDLSAGASTSFAIIGVVQGLKKPGETIVPPRVYRPMHTGSSFILALKPNQQLAKHQLAALLQQISPLLLIYRLEAFDQQRSVLLQKQQLIAFAAILLIVLSVLLTAVGLYGVINYHIQLRSAEIGVRLALGATRGRILRLFLSDHGSPATLGLLAGLSLILTVHSALHPQVQQFMSQHLWSLLLLTISFLVAMSLLAVVLPLYRCTKHSAGHLIHHSHQGH